MDFSQVMLSNFLQEVAQQKSSYSIDVNEDLLRHMILNSLRHFNVKFGEDYGKLVVACDDHDYWRKQKFEYYKANRKKDKEESFVNWPEVFKILNKIRDEVKEFFPYKTIRVPHAEADDVIATLTKRFYNSEPILIVSGDKDFQQLQQYPGVKQYSPVLKKYIECDNPELFLNEHIIRGDSGDGVPNILSPDDVFVSGGRQSPIMSKKASEWILQKPEKFCNEYMLRNYQRNQMLIDFEYIPEEMVSNINKVYDEFTPNSKMYEYFLANNLRNLMGKINEFK